MNTVSTIQEAVELSVKHNEIIRVESRDPAYDADALGSMDSVEEWDFAKENDGSLDVWGTTVNDEEFRIRIINA